jgi:hypothetical protein
MTELADVLDRYPELKTEAEIVSMLNLLAISKQGLREILERYKVASYTQSTTSMVFGFFSEAMTV